MQKRKVNKQYSAIYNMKKRGCSVNCIFSNFQSKGFYNDISFIKLGEIVTI